MANEGTTSALAPETTPPPAAPAATALGAGIQMTPDNVDWKSTLPDDLKTDPTIKNIKTVSDMAKMLQHAQKSVGADKIVVPGKHSTEEDYMKIFDKLGRPESPDKYDLKVPEGTKIDESFFKGFKETLHKSGVLPAQAQKMFDWYQGEVAKATDAQHKATIRANEEAVAGLQKEWGQAYPSKIQLANDGLKAVMGSETAGKLIADPILGNHPGFIKLAAQLGELAKEDSDETKSDGAIGRSLSPVEAKKAIGNILMDQKHPYNDAKHPNHKIAVEEMQRLFEMRNPQ